jgi:isopenicillin-N epimerase
LLCRALEIEPPCPDELIGALASVPLPDGSSSEPSASPLYLDPLQDRLLEGHAIEVPVIPWPAPPRRLLRISAQIYNSLPQYRRLAKALRTELGETSPR